MKNLKKLPLWSLLTAAFTAMALFFRFALLGYGYIGYTCAFIALLIVLHRFLRKTLWRIVLILVCIGLIYFALVEIPIVKNSDTDEDAEKPYLVVLGAAVHGDTASRALRYRLEAALDYLKQYPDAVAIVSGGQGKGENLSEAECMSRWLIDRGIAPGRILLEDKATSTGENLSFSYTIIRERGDEPDGNVAILSSSYHLYRAKQLSALRGVEAVGVSAYPGWFLIAANYYIREAFGVTKLWVLGE